MDQEHREQDQQPPQPADGAAPAPPPAAGAGDPAGYGNEPRYNPDSVARYYEQYYQYPYYGGAPRRGWPAWATVLIVVLVVIIGGCGALAFFAYRGIQNLGIFPSIPPAKVHTGAALGWRELDSWPGGGGPSSSSFMASGLSAADFDGDGDEDLLTSVPAGSFGFSTQQWRVYSVLGGQQLMGIQNSQMSMKAVPWDYQADGTIEIAADQYTEVQILDTSGQLVTRLPGSWQSQQRPLLGDIDGDGQDELLLYDNATGGLNAYDAQGAVIWGTPLTNYWTTAAGDVDGDGQDEVITESGFGLNAAGLGQAPLAISGWQPSSQHSGAIGGYSCVDLNGDGTDEIIAADDGYFDPVSAAMTSFSWPAAGGVGSYTPVWTMGAVAFDLDGDGALEIAVPGSRSVAGYGSGTGLYVFDLKGALVYYEEFGTTVHGVAVASAGGKEHLCILLGDRLIAWP